MFATTHSYPRYEQKTSLNFAISKISSKIIINQTFFYYRIDQNKNIFKLNILK